MGFTALQILWDDDENLDLDAEFLEDLYACWSGLKVNDCLSFTALPPPALVVVGFADPVLEVRSDCRIHWQELVELANQRLPRAPELLSAEAPPRRGPILSFGFDVVRNPLSSRAGPGLGGDSGHMRQAGLPPILIGDRVLGASPLGCGPSKIIRLLVAGELIVCRDPADHDFIFSGQNT